jgi:hypothetical protein
VGELFGIIDEVSLELSLGFGPEPEPARQPEATAVPLGLHGRKPGPGALVARQGRMAGGRATQLSAFRPASPPGAARSLRSSDGRASRGPIGPAVGGSSRTGATRASGRFSHRKREDERGRQDG